YVYQVVPDDWMLLRGKTELTIILLDVYMSNSSARVVWEPFWDEVEIVGYNIYRGTFDGPIVQITPTPVTGTEWMDTGLSNMTEYSYMITAIDEQGFESIPSEVITAWTVDMPMNMGMLVVDETRDMTGTILAPTDEQVDDFYSSVLTGMNYDEYDYTTEGVVTAELLGNYSIVLWHDDDFSEVFIDDNLNALGSYLLGGGNLIISGWKTAGQMDQDFLKQYFPNITPRYNNNSIFLGAYSDGYSDLVIDQTKVPANWSNALRMTYTFPNYLDDALYLGDYTDGEVSDGQAVIIGSENGVTLCGVPLYMFEETEVTNFFNALITEIDSSVENEETIQPIVVESLKAYPNPFNPEVKIVLNSKQNEDVRINVYNIRGQKVRTLFDGASKGQHEIVWNGKDSNGIECASGLYIIKASGKNLNLTKRVMMLK
ncbi:MAG: T9SS type A sorting domain-containing protein, partial [Candidatus Zophobacter franzmannii]|nr:T9SS type A sorting domain-containing protein [Candidatus Zophobacter franzmannii]